MERGMAEGIEAAEAVELSRRLPGVLGEMEGMEEALINRVFDAINKKTLTEGQAYFAWLELLSYRQLARRLKTRVAVGKGAISAVETRAKGAQGGK